MKKLLFILLLTFFQGFSQHNIIPEPTNFEYSKASFELSNKFNIEVNHTNKELHQYISNFKFFLEKSGINVSLNSSNKKINSLVIVLSKTKIDLLGNEGYTLEVQNNAIYITANNAAGIFNGLQTLRQLLPINFENKNFKIEDKITIKGCKIIDYPRFGWRGLMLDVSRHFFTVDEIKSYIDKMSQYKLNVFHWHLTDDEGWRIEIKSYPRLTEVGAWRVNRYGKFGSERTYPKEGEKSSYGGFYTQEDIKEVVKYAQERNITIVPEIDFPGHSMATLAAYPEFSVKQEPKFVNPGAKFVEWHKGGKFEMLIENSLNPIDEKVYKFIDAVFTEIASLFPGEYIHMGGDEAYHGYWKENDEIQKFMKQHKIKNTHELQSYFVKRVEEIISSKGKKMIGWDEILEGGLADDATVMSWRGMKGGIEAAKLEHNVVMSPTTYAYLDYTQGDRSIENKIYANLSLMKAYEFEPIVENINPKYVLGVQANVWTEAIPTMNFAFYMTYPRAFALAETGWSPKEKKKWNSFINKTQYHFKRFEASQTNISKAVYEPIISVYFEDDKLMCSLENNVAGLNIYYSVDNTYPVLFAQKYSKPFEIPEGDLGLRTQTYKNGIAISRELRISRIDLLKRVKK